MISIPIDNAGKTRIRFSQLFIPGNKSDFIARCARHSAHSIILDLEDSVAPSRKDEARLIVQNALQSVDFGGLEKMVRINCGKRGIGDLQYVIPYNADVIVIPKCESGDQVKNVEKEILRISRLHNIKTRVFLLPMIESALGIERAFEIAQSSESLVALAIGLEDLSASLGVESSIEGLEFLYARTRIVNAAKAVGIQAIDGVYSDFGDTEGLKRVVTLSKSLGFDGMGCIHPRQVVIVNDGYTPSDDDIKKSMDLIQAWKCADQEGSGVFAADSKMIELPVILRAQKILNKAVMLGILTGYSITDV